jgi:hypothetical protein
MKAGGPGSSPARHLRNPTYFSFSSSRRFPASQVFAIQVGTPRRGNTHFITAKYAASRRTRSSQSDI